MRTVFLVSLSVIASLLAGCAQEESTTPTPTPTATTTTTTTPATTTTPTSPTLTTPTLTTPTTPTTPTLGTATSIAVGDYNDTAEADADVEICWDVEGTGHVTHTAVHWDNESHEDDDNQTFASYAGGTMYPDNETAADPAGYDLPGTFCTTIPGPAAGESLYFVAHVIDATGAPGKLSDEEEIEATE